MNTQNAQTLFQEKSDIVRSAGLNVSAISHTTETDVIVVSKEDAADHRPMYLFVAELIDGKWDTIEHIM